jgi:DNA repair protein RecO (recombination protein O)
VAVAAKGAKRPTSQLRAVLMPFQRLAVSFGRARHEAAAEIHTLRSAEWAGGTPLRGGEALLSGFYLNELVMKLLARDDPHPVLWEAYAATLPHLGQPGELVALRAFELVLLREIGVLPDLARLTATLEVPDPAQRLALRTEAGLVPATPGDEAALPAEVFAALQRALDGGDFGALCRACLPCEAALRRQTRTLLAYHLGGAPLRTREVARDLQPLLHPR